MQRSCQESLSFGSPSDELPSLHMLPLTSSVLVYLRTSPCTKVSTRKVLLGGLKASCTLHP